MAWSDPGTNSAVWGGIVRSYIWILQDLKSFSIWAIFLMVMYNSACASQGQFLFYVPFPYTPFSYKEFHTVAGATYSKLNNLITSLQLSQAIWSTSFKRSNGRIILVAAFFADTTHLSGGLGLCVLSWLHMCVAFGIHRCYFNEMCLVFKYLKCLCMYILCWNSAEFSVMILIEWQESASSIQFKRIF